MVIKYMYIFVVEIESLKEECERESIERERREREREEFHRILVGPRNGNVVIGL